MRLWVFGGILAPQLEAMAQASRAQVVSLEQALEEREVAVARLGRELEAATALHLRAAAEMEQQMGQVEAQQHGLRVQLEQQLVQVQAVAAA